MSDEEHAAEAAQASEPSLMATPSHRLPVRHGESTVRASIVRIVALSLTGVLAFVGAGAGAAYIDLRQQMDVHDVDALLGDDRPTQVAAPAGDDTESKELVDPYADQALNIVVMGTDLRDGDNADVAGAATSSNGDGMRSDTTMLVHIAGDRSRAEVVSIPRDSLVTIPDCTRTDGSHTGVWYNTMFNEAFSLGAGDSEDVAGAAACTRRAIEQLTGVLTTDHVVVEMSGVTPIVDAIGGVRMCLPEPMVGRQVDLDLPAGEQIIDGETAIDFLRARKGTGFGLEMGSDLARIDRQQAFLDAAAHEISSKNMLTDSPTLYRVVEAVLGSISTSPGLGTPEALAGFANSLRQIPPDQIVFTNVPVIDAPTNRNRVVWTAEADAIWQRISADEAPPAPESEVSVPSDGESDGTQGVDGSSPSETQSGAENSTSENVVNGADSETADGAELVTDEPLVAGVCPD